MQQLRLIKGRAYLIDDIPHLFQERENGIYRFLKIDGSQKCLYENDLVKIKLTLQDEAYEQKLRDAESEISYYKQKYSWCQEQQEEAQRKHVTAERKIWFSDSKFVQLSIGLTLVAIIIFAVKVSFDVGMKSGNVGVGLITFTGILIGGILISLLVGWIAYKVEEFVDEEKGSSILIKLLFYLPIVWFALFKIFQLLFLSSTSAEE